MIGKILNKLLMAGMGDEEPTFSHYIKRLERGDFKDKNVFGIAESARGFYLNDPREAPGALACGGMGSGKSQGLRFTVLTHFLANSENTLYILCDALKGMNDYKVLFKYKSNVVLALDDIAKFVTVIDMVHAECRERQVAFSAIKAAHYEEYDKVMKEKDPSFPGIARIVLVVEEFHSVPNTKEVNFNMNYDRPGTVAYKLKELMAIGRSYGIQMFVASQRATSEDVPSTLKRGFTVQLAFRLNSPGDATAINNLPSVPDIRAEQRGRCMFEYGYMQFPYIDDRTAMVLLEKYGKPIKAKLLKHDISKYHAALEGEGNEGQVKVKPLAELIQAHQQYKLTDIAARVLSEFGFSVQKQTNPAFVANLIAEKDGVRFAVLAYGSTSEASTKVVDVLKRSLKTPLHCDSVIGVTVGSAASGAFDALVKSLKGFSVDGEDLKIIANTIDNKSRLVADGVYDESFKNLVLSRKIEKPGEVEKKPTVTDEKDSGSDPFGEDDDFDFDINDSDGNFEFVQKK